MIFTFSSSHCEVVSYHLAFKFQCGKRKEKKRPNCENISETMSTTTGKAESEVTDPEKFSGLSNGGDSGSEDESSDDDDDDLSQEMIRRMVQMRLQGPEKKEKPKVGKIKQACTHRHRTLV